jgi:hypothetical protein
MDSTALTQHVQHLEKHFKTVRLRPAHVDLVTSVSWVTTVVDATCDLDLSCALFDAKGKWLETVDFNDIRCGVKRPFVAPAIKSDLSWDGNGGRGSRICGG